MGDKDLGGFDPSRICVDDSDHYMCDCIVSHARDIMHHWTGSNCTWVDDDITALGILAGHAIRAGLHRDAAIPKTLIAAIDAHQVPSSETPPTTQTASEPNHE